MSIYDDLESIANKAELMAIVNQAIISGNLDEMKRIKSIVSSNSAYKSMAMLERIVSNIEAAINNHPTTIAQKAREAKAYQDYINSPQYAIDQKTRAEANQKAEAARIAEAERVRIYDNSPEGKAEIANRIQRQEEAIANKKLGNAILGLIVIPASVFIPSLIVCGLLSFSNPVLWNTIFVIIMIVSAIVGFFLGYSSNNLE